MSYRLSQFVNKVSRRAIGVAIATAFLSASGFAQGCALCYTSASAGGPGTAQALRSGILLLLIPPMALFASLVVISVRWNRNDSSDVPSVEPASQDSSGQSL